jgi:hypothetical protein
MDGAIACSINLMPPLSTTVLQMNKINYEKPKIGVGKVVPAAQNNNSILCTQTSRFFFPSFRLATARL